MKSFTLKPFTIWIRPRYSSGQTYGVWHKRTETFEEKLARETGVIWWDGTDSNPEAMKAWNELWG